jgi:hypothetical protein
MSHSALLSQFVIGLISRNQLWSACAPLSEAELERVSSGGDNPLKRLAELAFHPLEYSKYFSLLTGLLRMNF